MKSYNLHFIFCEKKLIRVMYNKYTSPWSFYSLVLTTSLIKKNELALYCWSITFCNCSWLIRSGKDSFTVHIMMAWTLCQKWRGMFEMCMKAYSREQKTLKETTSWVAVRREKQSLKTLEMFHVLTTLLHQYQIRYQVCSIYTYLKWLAP